MGDRWVEVRGGHAGDRQVRGIAMHEGSEGGRGEGLLGRMRGVNL